MGKKLLVIGAGFGGIAAALRARAKGYRVQLIDRCSQIGGRAQTYYHQGFKHDAGPTVITAPFLFEELFSLFGHSFHEHVQLKALNPWYQFHFSDGSTFNYGGSLEETLDAIRNIEPKDVAGYLKLLKHSEKIFAYGFEKLSHQPFHRFANMMAVLPQLIKHRNYQSVWQQVTSHIKNPKLQQAFSVHPLLIGGNPFDTTSIYSLIHFLERKWGVHFAMGGVDSIVKAFETLMHEVDIDIILNTTVNELTTKNHRVCGVRTASGTFLPGDVIVSNVDTPFLYSHLLHSKDQDPFTKLKTHFAHYSMGLYVLYFGTTKTYPGVEHHTIMLDDGYHTLLEDIFHKKTLSEQFSMYIHRPTATDPSFAPKDCDSFYVLVPVPNNQSKIDWTHEGEAMKERIIKRLSQTLLPDLQQYITAAFYKTPQDFEINYLSQMGSGFSIAPIFRQSAWFRYHNKDPKITNLYHVGAGTHPGAGMPGVLSSAKVLDKLLEEAT